ncbi:UDP-glucose dehydrogenase family protein [Effusibacillus pohliae]|uniref:UDP-glucose dehydrogenase family protein n=1 Tax=Effusibacillus pohliae TaxID=232270 RepID=UPI000376D89C|nr:UDP-glucose/GDP-mannose dehydrogenase family protein [Effusibacillus pohliae]
MSKMNEQHITTGGMKMRMKIGIVGAGYVGLVSAAVFADWGHDVVCVDHDAEKIGRIRAGDLPVYEPGLADMVERNRQAGRLRFTTDLSRTAGELDLLIIAVGTPAADDGHPDLTALWNVVHSLKQCVKGDLTVAIKSTVPIGTCQAVSRFLNGHPGSRFDVVAAPEFLRQGTAIADFLSPDRVVIGCRTEAAKRKMQQLFAPLACPLLFTDWQSAEMIKYAANAFLAMKISYINTIANLCEQVGADIQQVALGIGLDRRIGPAYLQPGIGFGGSCLPKDTQAIVALGKDYGVDVSLFREVLRVNREQRGRIVQKLADRLGGVQGKTIAVLGLAFKANTNDVREAPALDIITRIVQAGGEVVAYDPAVNMESLKNDFCFTPAADAYQAVTGADAVVILTEWEEFHGLDLQQIRSLMRHPLVIDGRNLYAPHMMKQHGFHYVPVGVPEQEVAEAAATTV